jgi:sigma-B regulation protein RsbU (phosphoserine phosphatase)
VLLYWLGWLLCGGCLLVLGYRAFKRHFMWRLRNRLIVTYVFIGVIPLVLLATIGVAAAYLFAGQFSTFVVTNDLHSELRRLESSNRTIAHHVADALRHGRELETVKPAINNEAFPERQVVVYYHGHAEALSDGAAPPPAPPEKAVGSTLILQGEHLYLRATHRSHLENGDEIIVVSSVPFDAPHLDAIVPNMGRITVYGEQFGSAIAGAVSRGSRVEVNNIDMDIRHPRIVCGSVPPPAFRADVEFGQFAALLDAMHWSDGSPSSLLLSVRTRPSLLYNRLFRTLGELSNGILVALVALAFFFALIEVAAFIIGVRLTRTMTSSVAKLYDATQHVNRGDFSHRIDVRAQDQLAALEGSFNSMTDSLGKLIAEQKEKQRIESELSIAKEVQDLLFPHDAADLDGLELHGVCRPARTVSGDYYDFLPVGANAVGLAVADISGKGISAALMMATLHAFVRAHTLTEKLPSLAAAQAAQVGTTAPVALAAHGCCPSPGVVLALLNQQLFQSTPAQKYATMFLSFYDQQSRRLTYSNAGHLPPIVLCADGSLHRLEAGGTVVGLFGDMTYEEGQITLNPGDTLIAFSDGITEPENDFGEFGEERLAQIVRENFDLPLPRISEAVLNAVTDWIGGEEQPDDMTVVLARAR